MTEIEIKNRIKDVRLKIKKKFKNSSRFSTISGVPYHFIQNTFKKKNLSHLQRIEKLIDDTNDKPIFDEVTDGVIKRVKNALKDQSLPEWCQDNGVPHWWLKQFLSGKVRFKNHPRVIRLMSLLKIN